MTYDDVADIKAALQVMVLLLQRMNDTLERIESNTTLIEDSVADIAHPLTPTPHEAA